MQTHIYIIENKENEEVFAIISVVLSPSIVTLLKHCVSAGTTSGTQNYRVNWFIVAIMMLICSHKVSNILQ